MSSSAGFPSARRPGTAYADRMAARRRRERFMIAGLGLLLVLILAYEVPKYVHLGSKKTPPVAAATTFKAPHRALSRAARELRRLRKGALVDPFTVPPVTAATPTPRDVPVPAGSIDPFAVSTPPPPTQTTTQPATTSSSPLPEQIIVGKPGGGRVATHGWIVILASIPTAQGQASAQTFARRAHATGAGAVSVLNSSNRKPLRGGYWVVYTGPFATLTGVSADASKVHTLGYPTAYIRELIVYH